MWSKVGSGLTMSPAAPGPTSKTASPSGAFATTRIRSAIWAWVTKAAVPFNVQASPSPAAVTATSLSVQPPLSPARATVTIFEPSAIVGSSRVLVASSPSAWISPAASTELEIRGAQSSAAPASSITRSNSTGPAPTPPYASSMTSPASPISANWAQSAGS